MHKENNIDAIAGYFRAGCKEINAQKTGVETECFIIDNAGKSISYKEIESIMRTLLTEGDKVVEEDDYFLGYYNKEFAISLEPAAQLEISVMPQVSLKETERILKEFNNKYGEILAKAEYTMVNTGYHPTCRAENLSLIPKKRYEYMNEYFTHTGSRGYQMMRATASTQVTIDYTDEEDFVKKFRLACVLAPVFSLVTENCPVYEGERNGKFLTRSYVWQDVDSKRCFIPDCTFEKDFGFRAYARELYEKPPILIKNGNLTSATGNKTISELYNEKILTQAEIQHLISMFFYDVRVKQYLEIRPGDSLPTELTLAYMALVKSVFYDLNIIDELADYLNVSSKKEIEEAKNNLMKQGYAGEIYGRPVSEVTDKIFELFEMYGDNEAKMYVKPLKKLAQRRITPAEFLWRDNL